MKTPVDLFDHLYCTEDFHQFCSTVHAVAEVEEDLKKHERCKKSPGGRCLDLKCAEGHEFCKKNRSGWCISHVEVVEATWSKGNEWRQHQYSNCKPIKAEVCDLCLGPIPERDYSSPLRDLHGAHRRCVDRLTNEQYRQWMNSNRRRY